MNYSNAKLIQLSLNLVILSASLTPAALAYPEFQTFSEKKSGRSVDCAMCHAHEHGPMGDEEGQISKLTQEQLSALNASRGALEPGSETDNPILNKFGNEIVKAIGMRKVLEAKAAPEKLAVFLGDKQDTDGDGIPDGKEFENGTHPLLRFHGDPWTLFANNLSRYRTEIVLAVAAIALLNFGFAHLIKALYLAAKARRLRGSP